MKTLLITAIAGDIAQAVATIAREAFPDWRILGCDVHERHGAQLFVDTAFLAPLASAATYRQWLEALVKRENIDSCIPMSEAELGYFAVHGLTQIAGARLVMPNPMAIQIGSDKLATARFLSSIDCPAPWTIPADEGDAATPFPCIFKPRRGAGSKGVAICNSLEDARFFSRLYPEAVLQELLLPEDREVTCAIYRTRDGRIAVLQLLRKLVGGFTGWAQVIDDAQVQRQCEQLALSLDLRGAINAQLRITDRGPRIFEINARFSSTALLRHRMGFADVVWSLREMLGERIELTAPAVNTVAVRTQGAALLADVRNIAGCDRSSMKQEEQ
jgi:carbamoyl-phosphate synthase large subunit